MIGYYIHHQGAGHLHRAEALAARLDEPVAGLSSLPRPSSWSGPWCELPRDDDEPVVADTTANEQLHWVPLGHRGLRSRTAALSSWIEQAQPRLLVADVSVEVALLTRLHGVPVISVVLPGRRTDPAHLLGFRTSTTLVGMWPPGTVGMTPGLPEDVRGRIVCVGAVSRLSVGSAPSIDERSRRRVVLLQGRGGAALTERTSEELAARTPGWEWVVLGGHGRWSDDVASELRTAEVVVTLAGESSVADVAAVRRPAIVIPAARPHEEQVTTASVLASSGYPVVLLDGFPGEGWPQLLERAASLDGDTWETWCDGLGAERFAELVAAAAREPDDRRTA